MIVKIRVRRAAPTSRRHQRPGRTLVIVLLFALTGTLYALFGGGGFMEVLALRSRATQLRHEILRAEKANRDMIEEIRALRDDPEAIERRAREELYLARPGEKVYILPRSPETDRERFAERPSTPSPPRR